ncbi:MAG TPA: sigma-70 family RNA polymerase sigma factor [Saprospiraceae bacterium]|nr:sigma-70 family RNA polymerase sigma factor [Saprospiraceae bacterium]
MLAAIKHGDANALKRLYQEYRIPFIQWLTAKYPIGEEDAKDIFQNVVVIFYDQVSSGKLTELRSGVKTYLFGIGKNLAHESMRKQQKYPEGPSELLINHVVDDSGYEDKMQFEADLRNAWRGLNLMGDPCKSILQLFYFERQSMESICQLMQYKNAETVKQKKFKCLKRLKKLMLGETEKEEKS